MRRAWLWRKVFLPLIPIGFVMALVLSGVNALTGQRATLWGGVVVAVLYSPAMTVSAWVTRRLTVEADGLREHWAGDSRLVAWADIQGVRRKDGAEGLGLDDPLPREHSGSGAKARAGFLRVEPFDGGFPASGPVMEALRRHRPDLEV